MSDTTGTLATPPIVDGDWLQQRLGSVVVADVQSHLDGTDGRAVHAKGHLPGAVWVDLDRDIAAPPTRQDGRHPLPTPEDFSAAMSRLGIGDGDVVVAYDQGHGGFAARLVWMLRVTGREAALLDGGLAAWEGDLEMGDVRRPQAAFAIRPWPSDRLADLDEVVARVADGGPDGLVLVDARAPERYLGEVEPLDPRAGHVPGARNLPFAGNLDAAGHFLPAEALRERFASAGLAAEQDVVVYCGSGVTACQEVLAMESVGIHARLFPGSWSQWSGREDLPAAVGPEPA